MAEAVAASAICSLDDDFRYRGYAVADLVATCSYEETAYLLIHGELPTAAELGAFQARVVMARRLPEAVRELFAAFPRWAHPLDVLRSAVSVLAHFDQDAADDSPEAGRRVSERLVAQVPVVVGDYFRASRGLRPLAARPELSHSANLLYLIRGDDANPAEVQALDAAMIVAAEYEFNPSSYTARVIASTGADLPAAVTGAVAALRGQRAGSATEQVLAVLQAASDAATVEGWAREAFSRPEGVVGFGSTAPSTGDPRPRLFHEIMQTLSGSMRDEVVRLEETAAAIERVAVGEFGLTPTIEWSVARLYHALGMDWSLFSPLFATARVAGWCAHVLEQQAMGERIRPRAHYTGPSERPVRPLTERGHEILQTGLVSP